MTEMNTITTFNVYVRQLAWMDEHKRNRSDFVRLAIDAAIEREEGPAAMLAKLKDRHERLMVELHELEEQMEALGHEEAEHKDKTTRDELLRKLKQEVRFGVGPNGPQLCQMVRELDIKMEDWEIEEIVERAIREV